MVPKHSSETCTPERPRGLNFMPGFFLWWMLVWLCLQNAQQLPGRIDLDTRTVGDLLRNLAVESGQHGDVPERGALRKDRIHAVEYQRSRNDPARSHLAQHPCARHAALGGVEHEDFSDIRLSRQLVGRAREGAADAVEVVARREAVVGDQRLPRDRLADRVPCD